MQLYDFGGEGRQIDAKASFVRYEWVTQSMPSDADPGIRVRADGVDLGVMLPGDYVRLARPACTWIITPRVTSCAGAVRLGMGEAGSARVVVVPATFAASGAQQQQAAPSGYVAPPPPPVPPAPPAPAGASPTPSPAPAAYVTAPGWSATAPRVAGASGYGPVGTALLILASKALTVSKVRASIALQNAGGSVYLWRVGGNNSSSRMTQVAGPSGSTVQRFAGFCLRAGTITTDEYASPQMLVSGLGAAGAGPYSVAANQGLLITATSECGDLAGSFEFVE